MNVKTVGIIGGNGKMGQYFAQFFENREFTVLIGDIGTSLSNKEVAQKSDLLIFSVPINETVKIIDSVSDFIKEEMILFDLTSIKTPAVEAMLKTKAKEIVGGHPMFAPTVSLMEQVFVLTPGRGENGLEFLKKIFSEAGAHVKIIEKEKHDKLMTVIQSLNHFTDISFAHALSKTGLEIHDFLEFQSPAYRMKLIMMGRILAQNPSLYGSILTQNPLNKDAIKLFEESSKELSKIVEDQDLETFEKYFKESAEYLNDFAETAMKESDIIIEQIFQRKIRIDSNEEDEGDVAILGPKNTYSDFACSEVFEETKSKKYCRTIQEIFENVSSEKTSLGLVPVENKLAGPVNATYDSFWEFENVEVVGEMNLKIDHVLASLKPIPLKNIEKVFSHTSALTQCSRFLEKYRDIKIIPVSSTSEAVFHLTQRSAVIIPARAARKSHLTILKENISNSSDNYTRFYLIKKKDSNSLDYKNTTENCIRTVLAFELFKTRVGSLLKVLQYFYEQGINLLKLESKPVGDDGDTIFFVDTEGAMTEKQLKGLEERVATLKVFGLTKKLK